LGRRLIVKRRGGGGGWWVGHPIYGTFQVNKILKSTEKCKGFLNNDCQ
jgi:hypothetical protein